jgi:hypothetical protein
MPVISELYSSQHLKPGDLGVKPMTAVIGHVSVETFENDGVRRRKRRNAKPQAKTEPRP